jgi:magnesium-transporting ATPase (P-type)
MRFTRNVMDEIARHHIAPATKEYINKKIIWGIAAFFITVIVSFVVYGISQVDWSTGSSDGTLGNVNLTQVDYSSMFNNTYINLFMGLNIILGLMLFDRYLAARKEKYMKEA